ncbi:uncharacterized protein Bfra_004724 [Botrytis fragariae]|uniref:Uncharacterized protein n=1 Tax=Botrytis fragariae TaxID=1964551 RepID=A0A8H6EJQ1_9HELO|nr:uncharacterized protein Bfra_004724 [Botrytis fragariae]KAF5874709.1 hypothetical protein Bfra_004724 [Botrytis fragariae]
MSARLIWVLNHQILGSASALVSGWSWLVKLLTSIDLATLLKGLDGAVEKIHQIQANLTRFGLKNQLENLLCEWSLAQDEIEIEQTVRAELGLDEPLDTMHLGDDDDTIVYDATTTHQAKKYIDDQVIYTTGLINSYYSSYLDGPEKFSALSDERIWNAFKNGLRLAKEGCLDERLLSKRARMDLNLRVEYVNVEQ